MGTILAALVSIIISSVLWGLYTRSILLGFAILATLISLFLMSAVIADSAKGL